MSINIKKHINKNEANRIEFLFVGFDYYDGNDLIAKLLCEDHGMLYDEKVDGIHYHIIKLHKNQTQYELVWHEDVGNYIFSMQQDNFTILDLERSLQAIVNKLNKMLVE